MTDLDKEMSILRRSGSTKDGHGQPSSTFTVSSTVMGKLSRKVSQSKEPGAGVQGVVTVAKAIMLPGADILSSDRLMIDGQTYAVIGQPYEPNGHHIEVNLEVIGEQ